MDMQLKDLLSAMTGVQSGTVPGVSLPADELSMFWVKELRDTFDAWCAAEKRGQAPAVYIDGAASQPTQRFVGMLCMARKPLICCPGLLPAAAEAYATVCNDWLTAHLDGYQCRALMNRALETTKKIRLNGAPGETATVYDALVSTGEAEGSTRWQQYMVYSMFLYRDEMQSVLSALRRKLNEAELRRAIAAYASAVKTGFNFLCREIEDILSREPGTRAFLSLFNPEKAGVDAKLTEQVVVSCSQALAFLSACLDQEAMDDFDAAAKRFRSRNMAARFFSLELQDPALAIVGSLLWMPELLAPEDRGIAAIPTCMDLADRLLPRLLPEYVGNELQRLFCDEECSAEGAISLKRAFAIPPCAEADGAAAAEPRGGGTEGPMVKTDVTHCSFGSLFFALTGFCPPNGAGVSQSLVARLRDEFHVPEPQAHELAAAAFTARHLQPAKDTSVDPDLDAGVLECEQNLLQESSTDPVTVQPGPDAPVAALQEQCSALAEEVRTLREQNKKLKAAWHDEASRANRAEGLLRDERESADEDRAELVSLREAIFALQRHADAEMPAAKSVKFPVHTTRAIRVFGGHDSFLREIRAKLPDVQFLGRSFSNFDAVKGADIIWMQVNAMSHPLFHGVADTAKQCHIPVRYLASASATKCALQILEEESLFDA